MLDQLAVVAVRRVGQAVHPASPRLGRLERRQGADEHRGPRHLFEVPVGDERVVEPCRLDAAGVIANHDVGDAHAAPRLTDHLFRDGSDHGHLFPIEELIDRLAKLAPLERLGQPGDVAAVVAFLTGPDGGWINGQVLRANGGMV